MNSIVKGAPRPYLEAKALGVIDVRIDPLVYEQLNDHITSHDSFFVSENLIYAK